MASGRHKPAITRALPFDRRGVHHPADLACSPTVSWLAPGLWPDVGHEPYLLPVYARLRKRVGVGGAGASDGTVFSAACDTTMAKEAWSRRGLYRLLAWKPYSVVRLDPTSTAPSACSSVSTAARGNCAG